MKEKPLIKDRIADLLRTQILNLQSDIYVKIASERELADSMKVSRISLRSAIKRLVNEGLLIQEQGRGTYIAPSMTIKSLSIICSPDIKSTDPFYNKFLVEITNTAAKLSISLNMVNPEQISCGIEPSPLIVIGLLEKSLLDKLTSVFSTVITFQESSEANNTIQISFDDYQIGQLAASAFRGQQHQHLILLAGPDKYPSASNRKKGFIDALKGSDVKLTTLIEKMNWSGGYKAGDTIGDFLTMDHPPTAAFAANDWMAVGLIQKLKERGFRIPRDLSVIGCDDIPLAAEYSPTLTTFNLDTKALVTELLAILNVQGSQSNKKILLPAAFIHRESLIRFRKKRGD